MNPEDAASTTPPANQPNLGLQDLIIVVNMIQVFAKRGAIQAEEMTLVGPLYERLVAFLQASGALTPPPAPSTETASTDAEPTQTGEQND